MASVYKFYYENKQVLLITFAKDILFLSLNYYCFIKKIFKKTVEHVINNFIFNVPTTNSTINSEATFFIVT